MFLNISLESVESGFLISPVGLSVKVRDVWVGDGSEEAPAEDLIVLSFVGFLYFLVGVDI